MTTIVQPQILVPDCPDELHPCAVCAHDMAGHDRVGLRYCQATQANALPRGCICRGAKG